MEAILPLTQSATFRAGSLLLPSLLKNYRDLSRLWVASPAAQLSYVRKELSGLNLPPATFISDEELLPELSEHARWGLPPPGGWYRQQVIKLAISERIEGAFYLTLDDDLISVSPFSDSDIIHSGRALRDQDLVGYRMRISKEDDENAAWLTASAWILRCSPLAYQPDLTPSVLSRTAVGSLIKSLRTGRQPSARRWKLAAAVAFITGRKGLNSWRGRLLAHSARWSEYSLYDTHLESRSEFHKYHYHPTNLALLGNAVWKREDFAEWTPSSLDTTGRRLLFNLVQSRAGIGIDKVAERLNEQKR